MLDIVLQRAKRSKGNREYILAIKDCNGGPITYSTDKTDSLNSYYVSVFGCERNTPQIKQTHSGKPCTTNIKMIRKRSRDREKQISGAEGRSWRNSNTGQGSHDSVISAVAGYNN